MQRFKIKKRKKSPGVKKSTSRSSTTRLQQPKMRFGDPKIPQEVAEPLYVQCEKCLRRLRRVENLYKTKRRDRSGDSFQGNSFKDVLPDLTKKRAMSSQNLKLKSSFAPKKKVPGDRSSKSAKALRVQTLTSRMKQMENSTQELKDKNKWEFMRNQCILQQADWSKSSLYQQFLKHGRSLLTRLAEQHSAAVLADSVYTETELHYYIDFL